MLCISLVSVATSLLSFQILFIWVLSPLFLMSRVKGVLVLFIFSQNQLLALLILWIVLLVSMSFNSALALVISFLLLALGFVCCSSCSCRFRVRLFIWNVSIFFRYACVAMNFPLRAAFVVSHKLWTIVCMMWLKRLRSPLTSTASAFYILPSRFHSGSCSYKPFLTLKIPFPLQRHCDIILLPV